MAGIAGGCRSGWSGTGKTGNSIDPRMETARGYGLELRGTGKAEPEGDPRARIEGGFGEAWQGQGQEKAQNWVSSVCGSGMKGTSRAVSGKPR